MTLPEVLDGLLTALLGLNAPKTIALMPKIGTSDPSDFDLHWRSAYARVPMLPASVERHLISDGEPFVQEAISTCAASKADCVLIHAPCPTLRQYSEEWKKMHGSLQIVEVVSEAIFQPLGMQDSLHVGDDLSSVQIVVLVHHLEFSPEWRRRFYREHSAIVIEFEDTIGSGKVPITDFSVVIFSRNAGSIRFFRVPEMSTGLGLDALVDDFLKLISQSEGKTKFGFVHSGQLHDHCPYRFDFYSHETEELLREIERSKEISTLSSIANVLEGFSVAGLLMNEDVAGGSFQYISGVDITMDGRVDQTEAQTRNGAPDARYWLEDGDFCIRKIYRGGRFIVGVYESNGKPMAFNNSVVVVRPHQTLTPSQRQILLSFLRSPLAHDLNAAGSSSLGDAYILSAIGLRKLTVPIADEELNGAISELIAARSAFSGWIREIDADVNALFFESQVNQSRNQLLQSGQLARQRHRAAHQVEELDYRVRTQFPHPLAYVWREVQVAGPDLYHRLRAILKAAEAHTCFVALTALLLGQATGQRIGYLQDLAARFSNSRRGVSFGDWFAVLKEVNEKRAFQQLQGSTPFIELTALCEGEQWEPAIRVLMRLRNDDGHQRLSPSKVSPGLVTDSLAKLESVFSASEFLTDYQLVFVTETRYDSIRKITRIRYRDLTGDNPLAPLREEEAARADMETGSLYLRDRQKNLHLFRPLLHYLECPECHQMSTFFLDTYDGASGGEMVSLKSIERNSVREEAFAEDFRHIGLLKAKG